MFRWPTLLTGCYSRDRDAVELVQRIHTRNDIEWSTLNDLL